MTHTLRGIFIALALAGIVVLRTAASAPPAHAASAASRPDTARISLPRFSITTNMLYDLLLTPQAGIEYAVTDNVSVAAKGLFSWLASNKHHRYWRIAGSRLEGRFWIDEKHRSRLLTGHHIGVYCSLYKFDFELGGTGYKSIDATYGLGISYGYSLKLNTRLNLDLGLSLGYYTGCWKKYHPEGSRYVCDSRRRHHHVGLTGIDVTLVWFP